MKDKSNKLLGKLNNQLRESLVDTKEISISDWNREVAPCLEKLGMIIDKVNVTARTFRLPNNYFE